MVQVVANTITEPTRRDIIDYFTLASVDWAGHLMEPDFLGRLYDLTSLPSKDPRFKSARGDIGMHRVNFRDWENDWVFTDNRFGLLWVSDEEFLRFLCETVHPVVRPDSREAHVLVADYNARLQRDGWEIYEESEISGRPLFAARRQGQRAIVFDEPTGWERVDRQMQEISARLQEAAAEEQCQAVGLLCREALISLAQAVFEPRRHLPDGAPPVSPTDASAMLQAFFEAELAGAANEEARAHAKAALKLANALQHKRTATHRMAALSAEASAAVVNLAAVLSGRRDSWFA